MSERDTDGAAAPDTAPDTAASTPDTAVPSVPEARLPPWQLALRGGVALLLAWLAYRGWRELWFLTDDAYITFRYASNSLAGLGYTYNAPPFPPVEGYSNFLWLVLLDLYWRLTGVAPPQSANTIALAFSYGTLALGFALVWRLELPERLARARFWLAATVLLLTLSNRTFLTWMSSGLETALFTFCVTLWTFCTIEIDRLAERHWPLALSSTGAAMAALTRPDGLLLAAASGILLVRALIRGDAKRLRTLASSAPLVAVPVHLIWRRLYYGDWLPNTYYAKVSEAWPESGLRYALSFLLEYGMWLLLPIALVLLVVRLRRDGARALAGEARQRPALVAVIAVLAAHAGYYTLIVGGDHFEYRVYAHLVLPLMVSLLALCAALRLRWPTLAGVIAAYLVLSLPIPWTHYALTRSITDRSAARMLKQPVAGTFPASWLPYAGLFDRQQAWLISHYVCLRHQDHKTAHAFLVGRLPSRAEGRKLGERLPSAMVSDSIGIVGWVLPNVLILDVHGLTDPIVARSPRSAARRKHRLMAHEHTPPPGYFGCFEPNIYPTPRSVAVRPRRTQLDVAIRRCLRHYGKKKR